MMEQGTMPQPSQNISYDAIPLDDSKAVKEDEAAFDADISDFNELDLTDFDFLEPDDQEDEDEWEP